MQKCRPATTADTLRRGNTGHGIQKDSYGMIKDGSTGLAMEIPGLQSIHKWLDEQHWF